MMGTTNPRQYCVHSGRPKYIDAWNEVLSREFVGRVFAPAQPDNCFAKVGP